MPQLVQADAVLGIMLVVISLASFVSVEAVHCVLAGLLVGVQISHFLEVMVAALEIGHVYGQILRGVTPPGQ